MILMTLVAKMFVLVAAVSFYVLMKKSCSKKIRYIPPIEDVLLLKARANHCEH